MHLAVRVLHHHAARIPDEADRQDQRELSACGLVQETGREAGADRVQLDFGEGALEPEQQAPIGGAGVVDAVAVGDKAVLVAAQIEQRIPVRTVPGQAGDLGGENDANLAERDACDQVLEALAVVSGRAAQPEVGIDDLDVLLTPPEAERALAQIVLQAQTLLIGQHLVRAGLADVDDRAAGQMPVGDKLRSHGSPL